MIGLILRRMVLCWLRRGQLLRSVLLRGSARVLRERIPSHHCVPEKFQYSFRGLLLPQPFCRGSLRVLPPACLPYLPPQLPDLGRPCLKFGEEMVTGLPLAALAPPARIVVGVFGRSNQVPRLSPPLLGGCSTGGAVGLLVSFLSWSVHLSPTDLAVVVVVCPAADRRCEPCRVATVSFQALSARRFNSSA